MKVLVAMSGGVDSSVAAALLKEAGHDVTGVHLRLSDAQPADGDRAHGCCGITDADDARRVAQVLDIPFYVWGMQEEFSSAVIDDFVGEYTKGRTPNPCVRCNEKVKFGLMLDRAISMGFDALATGHYAKLDLEGGQARLSRAADAAKDQSYVLARTSQERLRRCAFPLGALLKPEVRSHAERFGLRTANKPESFDICFTAGQKPVEFVGARVPASAGKIVDTQGQEVGTHDGVFGFTIGQRRGLGLQTHRRLHVIAIDSASSTVTVGEREALGRTQLKADEVVWTQGEPQVFDTVQVRAHGGLAPAELDEVSLDSVTIRLGEPLMGVAPGQLVAFYRGDEVIGGATISEAAAP